MNKPKQNLLSLTLAILMCITSLPFAALADETRQPCEWFVSTDGDDVNGTGTIDNPFKSLQKGADMLGAGDTLYIRGGAYYESFEISASGTADAPITIKNYNNEEVTIRATSKLENWSNYGDNIWVADMPWDMEPNSTNMLYNGEKSLVLARYPNISESANKMYPNLLESDFADRTTTDVREEGIIEDSDLDMPDGYWDGAKVNIQAGLNWINIIATVDGYETGVLNIGDHSMSSSSYYNECSGDPYFIFDHFNALDTNDEYYFDRENNKMYFYSTVDPDTLEMGARSSEYVVDMTDCAYINIIGFNLLGAPPKVTAGSYHINFEWIELDSLSRKNSFDIPGDYITIKHSHIHDAEGAAVTVGGRNNAVFNCLIEDSGWYSGEGSGLNINNAMYAYAGYNTIRNAGRTCAAFSGTNSVYEYNDIYGSGLLTHDTGPTYAVCNSGGMSELRYNWIHDNRAKESACGLYYDNGSSDIAIHHNVVWQSDENGLLKNGWISYISNDPAVGMSVYNNTFIGDAHMAKLAGIANDGRLMNNIFFGEIQDNVKFTAQRNNMVGWLDPKFVDLGGKDFRLTEESLAIDKGVMIEGITENYAGDAPDLGAYEYGGEDWVAGRNFENPPNFEHKIPNYIKYHNVIANGGFEDDQELKPELVRTTRMFNPDYYGWSIMDETEGNVDQEYSWYFNGKVNGEVRRTGNIGVKLGDNTNIAYPGDETIALSTQIIELYDTYKNSNENYPQEMNNLPNAFYALLENSSNLLPNGDFEDPAYTLNVMATGMTNTDEDAVSGSRSLKIHDMRYSWSGLAHQLPATSDRKFRVSFNVKPDVSNSILQLRVKDHHPTDWEEENDRLLVYKYLSFSGTDWQKVSFDFDTNGPTAGLRISSLYSNWQTGHYYIDDFIMLDITEVRLIQEAATAFPEAKAIIDNALANTNITQAEMASAVRNCVTSMLNADRDEAIDILVPILKAVRNSKMSAGAGITYTIRNLKPGRQYRLHCNAWVKDPNDSVVFSIKQNNNVLVDYTTSSTAKWSDEYVIFTAPENGEPVVLEIWKPLGKRAAYVDDVAVREYDPVPYRLRLTSEYIENKDFESEYLWPWYSFDADLELVQTDKGQSLKVTNGRAMQDVTILPGRNIAFSADFKLAMPFVTSKQVQIVVYAIENTSNGQRYEFDIGQATITNDSWTHIEGKIEIPADLVINSMGYTAGLVDGTGTFLMDNANIERNTVDASFVYNGITYYYADDVIEYENKKYFKILKMAESQIYPNDTNNAYYYYLVEPRANGGIYYTQYRGDSNNNLGTNLQDLATCFDDFTDYKISSDFEWECGKFYYNGKADAYTKGSINLASRDDLTYIKDLGISFKTGGQHITSTFFEYGGRTNRRFYESSFASSALSEVAANQLYRGDKTSVASNYVTYISEDFFIENELDIANTGEELVTAIRENISRDDIVNGGHWTEQNINLLYPYRGDGFGIVYNGITYYYADDVIEYENKKYFKILKMAESQIYPNDTNNAYYYYSVEPRANGGIYYTQYRGNSDNNLGTNLQNLATCFDDFSDYKISSDFEWECGKFYYNGNEADAYTKGSINVASRDDLTYIKDLGISFKTGGQHITSTFFVYQGTTNRRFYESSFASSALSEVVVNQLYRGTKTSVATNYVTYISEDFFIENEVDIANTGEELITAIRENISRDDIVNGGHWTEQNINLLYPYRGEGLGIVADITKDTESNEIIVNVVLYNNGGETIIANGLNLVVAAYDGSMLDEVKMIMLNDDIRANSMTSTISVPLTVTNTDEQVKVMAWNSLIPVCKFVSI